MRKQDNKKAGKLPAFYTFLSICQSLHIRQGPNDEHGVADDLVKGDGPHGGVPAVHGIVPVVAHDEITVLRHG